MSGRFTEALALQQEGERIVRKSTANDPNNKVAQRDLALIGLSQARTLLQAGQPRAARPLLAKTLKDLPPADTLVDDFYLGRWRAETLIWSARAWLDNDPAQSRRFAEAAVALVQSLRTDPSNAAWHWTLALALGEDAAAAAAQGQTDDAARLAQQALDRWAKAFRTLWAWPLPRSTSPRPLIATDTTLWITSHTCCVVTDACRRAFLRRPLLWRATLALVSSQLLEFLKLF